MATPRGGNHRHHHNKRHAKRHDRDDDRHNDHQALAHHGTDAFRFLIHEGVLSTVHPEQHHHQSQTLHRAPEHRDESWQRAPRISHYEDRPPFSVFVAHEIPRLDEQHDTIKAVSFSPPLPHSLPATVDGGLSSHHGFQLIHGDRSHAASDSNVTLSGGHRAEGAGEIGFYPIHSHDVALPTAAVTSDSTKSRDQHTIIWGTTMILANDLRISFTDFSHLTHHGRG